MSLSSVDPGSSADRAGFSVGMVALVLAVLAALPVFWLGITSLGAAWATPEYSHGPLIPLISLGLFLRELRDRTGERPVPTAGGLRDTGPGLALGVLALGLALAGNAMGLPDIVAYSLILWVGAVMLVAMGWTRGRRHWAPVLHLVFMLPLPQMLYWGVTTWLQGVSAQVGVYLVDLAGVPVFLQGHVIDLGVYKLEVAEACAGLRYLFPILSFSYLTAILYRGPMAHKLVLFAMAAPVAVILNAVRIGRIGVLVDRFGIEQAEGALHLFQGWVVFGLSLVILYATALALARLRPDGGPVLDLDSRGLGQQASAVLRLGRARWLLALGAVTLAAALAGAMVGPPRTTLDRVPFIDINLDLGRWDGLPTALDPEVTRVLGADDYIDAVLMAEGATPPAQMFVAWYANQNGGTGIHSPTVCLPAAGWEISDLRQVSLPLDGGFRANRAIITRDLNRQLVYYWFDQGGRRVTGDWQAKALGLRRSLTEGRADGALVRFVTEIGPEETEADAEDRLLSLMAEALPRLITHLPR